MTLVKRLRDLEEQSRNSTTAAGALKRLSEELERRTKRLRSIPTERAVLNAAPMDVAALALDGRRSEEIEALCNQSRQHQGPVGKLFQMIGALNAHL